MIIKSNSKILDARTSNNGEYTIIDVYPTEIDHNALKNLGGDPHKQYLDMIRHAALSHEFFHHMNSSEIFITPKARIKNIVVATNLSPVDSMIDITKNGTSIFDSKIYKGSYKGCTFIFDIPTIIDGGCEDGDIILIDSPINIFVRFDFW